MTNVEMTIATPALLFPAISLLMLAYTNRFVSLASLIRGLSARDDPWEELEGQLTNLRKRIELIRQMQIYGLSSFLLCSLSMLVKFIGIHIVPEILFGVSLFLISCSIFYSLREIRISSEALNLELDRQRRLHTRNVGSED